MLSSAACWAAYGEVLDCEYSDPDYFAVHRLSADAYAVQHPGEDSPPAVQSVAVHLIGLHLVLDHEFHQGLRQRQRLSKGPDQRFVMSALRRAAELGDWVFLSPPASMGDLTAVSVLSATDATEHRRRVTEWARSSWLAWSAHHQTIREWSKRVCDQ